MKALHFTAGLMALTALVSQAAESMRRPERYSRLEGDSSLARLSRNSNTQVGVLLAKHPSELHIVAGSGRLRLLAPGVEADLGTEATLRPVAGSSSVRVGGIVVPANGALIENPNPPYLLRVGARYLRGPLKLGNDGRQVMLVTSLPLETYLKGTVGAEMPSNWELEALKAQAIASRTYALTRIRNPKSPWYHLESDVEDQVFQSDFKPNRRINAAIDSTAGIYLQNGDAPADGRIAPLKAFFHSRCGGQTETPRGAWGSNENRTTSKSVSCPSCRNQPGRWALEFPLAALSRIVGLSGREPIRVAALQRSPAGRVQAIEFDAGDSTRTLTGEELRALIGYARVKSTLFDVESREGRLVLKGYGIGHGVGMCQFGAQHLARAGKSYDQILTHYYPLSRLARLD